VGHPSEAADRFLKIFRTRAASLVDPLGSAGYLPKMDSNSKVSTTSDNTNRVMAAVDHIITNKASEEISRAKPEEISVDAAFERDMRQVRILKDLADEVGPGGVIHAGSVGVAMFKGEPKDPAGVALKERLDGNRASVNDGLFGGKQGIYQEAETLRYMVAFSADGNKAVALSYQRIDCWPSGKMSSQVGKTVLEGEECAKAREFATAMEGGEPISLQSAIDEVAEKKLIMAGTPNFSRSMTETEFNTAVRRSGEALGAAKDRLFPMVSAEAWARMESPSHESSRAGGSWEFRGGRAHFVSLADRSAMILDKLRAVQEPEKARIGSLGAGSAVPNPAMGSKAGNDVGGR
jgi:hypothetical protein